MSCKLCQNRKAALSPYHANGFHNHLGQLPDPTIEAIHRIRTDAGRLKKFGCQGLLALGLSDAHYVELVAVVSEIAALDTFNRGMGRPLQELPKPAEGRSYGNARQVPEGQSPGSRPCSHEIFPSTIIFRTAKNMSPSNYIWF